MPDSGRPRVVLAFDFGLRRIGMAAGDTLTASARALRTVRRLDTGPDWTAIDRELALHAPDLLVVGSPYNDNGTPTRLAPAATAFADALAQRYRLQVERVDERYSSVEAHSRLREQRASGQRRKAVDKGDIDSAAAAVILESWLAQRN